MLRLRELTVRRGGTSVVQGLDWSLPVGRIHWIVGPNGAGKSSLLRVMAGVDRPHSGSIDRPAGWKALHMEAQTAFPAGATVEDWDRLMRSLLPVRTAERSTSLRPHELPQRRRLDRVSTGERKRLLLDALLRQDGNLLLLDEPYEHLSPDAKAHLTELLEARARVSVVVAATNQATDRVVQDGGIRLEGGITSLLEGSGT